MSDPASCPCGLPLVNGRCTRCGSQALFGFVRREIAGLVILSAAAIVLFAFTGVLSAINNRQRLAEAADWYRVAPARREAGRAHEAADALQRASAIDRTNQDYRLALAGALAEAGDLEASRRVLVGLRALAPENPDVNLRLARLEAARGSPDTAVRYYQSALYGQWGVDAASVRQQIRLELVRYLLAQDQQSRALAELLVVEGNLPDDTGAQLESAALFAEAGDPRRALGLYARVLARAPRHQQALAGAGQAAFDLGDYARAGRYLRALPEPTAELAELRQTADLVRTRDPLLPRLRFAERVRRLRENLQHAMMRLEACAGQSGDAAQDALLTEAHTLQAQLRRRTPQDVEMIEAGMDLVARLEGVTERCAPIGALDRALVLIARRYQPEEP